MDPELETLQNSFNTRIEDWISKQGLLFQFTHDTGSGSMFPKICGLLFRLLIIALIGVVIFWFYLTNRPNSEAFKLDVEHQITKGMNAGEVKISNISRAKGGVLDGEMLLSTLFLGETDLSFFEDWYVEEEDVSVVGRRSTVEEKKTAVFQGVNLSPLGIGDNYFSGWSAREINILKMELKLKTGNTRDELAEATYSNLFKNYKTLKIDAIQVFDATIFWGHSEITSGSIKGAQLDITKGNDSWEIDIRGGTFSHHWLQDCKIDHMQVICHRSGEVEIRKAVLNLGEGELNFTVTIQATTAQPELKGEYSFKNVEVTDLIGDSYKDWLDGNINGAGVLAGNLNSSAGVKATTTITLSGKSKSLADDTSIANREEGENDSMLIIRGDRFQLLKLMQMKNPRNSYSLLRAYKGALIVENQGTDTQVTVKDVRFGHNDLILMRGKFDYAIRSVVAKEDKIDASSLEIIDEEEDPVKGLVSEDEIDTFRAFSGNIELGLIPDVFENNMSVLEVYPVDNSTLRVWFDVDLKGQLEELTEELADELYDIMKAAEKN